jgi:bifunctional non-homologous end joining protein LigD
VGKVGTGFTDEVLADLTRRLSKLRRTNSPFADPLPRAEQAAAHWVRPGLVGEVRFAEWTKDGRLRHPSWRGLRDDKKPAEVVPES